MRICKIATAVFITLCGVHNMYGQKAMNNLEFGFNLGNYIYQGDLTPAAIGSYKTPGWGVMIFAKKQISNSFSVRANMAYATLRGDDAKYTHPSWRRQRNFNFRSRVIELSGLLVWDILPKTGTETVSSRFTPYMFGGLGLSFFKTSSDWGNFNQEYFAAEPNVEEGLITDAAHAPAKMLPVIPIGAGVKYAVNPKLSVFAESAYRFTYSDYIDGFSKAAKAFQKDSYYNISVGLTYRFGKGMLDCPVVPK